MHLVYSSDGIRLDIFRLIFLSHFLIYFNLFNINLSTIKGRLFVAIDFRFTPFRVSISDRFLKFSIVSPMSRAAIGGFYSVCIATLRRLFIAYHFKPVTSFALELSNNMDGRLVNCRACYHIPSVLAVIALPGESFNGSTI
jgi:hypothetical protein